MRIFVNGFGTKLDRARPNGDRHESTKRRLVEEGHSRSRARSAVWSARPALRGNPGLSHTGESAESTDCGTSEAVYGAAIRATLGAVRPGASGRHSIVSRVVPTHRARWTEGNPLVRHHYASSGE